MLKKKFNVALNFKIKSFKKNISVDSDKSISIRSFLIGSIGENISLVNNVLESDDVISAIKCLKNLVLKSIRKNKILSNFWERFGVTRNKERFRAQLWKLWYVS